jgi:DNA-binding transcriptional LysR family regulator
MQEPVETSELLAFTRTVEARSLSRAAAELGVPRATISRRLARLEARLDARLLRRTTRSLVLTDAGEALYRHARIVLDAVTDAEASVRRTDDAIRGDLRVSVPPGLPPSFHAMVCDFVARYPDVRLQLLAASRHVDLHRDGYDVALRASSEIEPGLIARKVATDRLIAVASPAYLAAHGTPITRRELAKHRCLMGFARGELPQTHWPFGKAGKMQVDGVLFSNDLILVVEAAARGLGIALLPRMFVAPLIERGELVQILAGTLEVESQVAVVYVERELMPPQVRAFIDAIVTWARAELNEQVIEARCREAITAASGRGSKDRSKPGGDRSRPAGPTGRRRPRRSAASPRPGT